jgi:DNA-directed RNA polymerase subunit RPC12/RpoP
MPRRLDVVFGGLKRVVGAVVKPLRKDPDAEGFRLSSSETHTTTIDGDVGWANRPSALVRCSRCGADIVQRHSDDNIDCPRCVAEFSHDEFADLELLGLSCPKCGSRMEDGQRHPNAFDVPEWATCHDCRYHWEFGHWL